MFTWGAIVWSTMSNPLVMRLGRLVELPGAGGQGGCAPLCSGTERLSFCHSRRDLSKVRLPDPFVGT